MNGMNIDGVIKGLKCLSGEVVKCKTCEYYEGGLGCRSRVCADAVNLLQKLLKKQEAEIKRLKRPDCEHAEHDGLGCLGYCGCKQDDEPIESCKRCKKYTGNIAEAAMWETIKETPNKITAVLKVTATAEFFDDEASEETVRYVVEQDLEGAGFDVDVALLKEQEAVEPKVSSAEQRCGNCNKVIEMDGWQSCPWCGKRIDWKGWWKKNDTHDQNT